METGWVDVSCDLIDGLEQFLQSWLQLDSLPDKGAPEFWGSSELDAEVRRFYAVLNRWKFLLSERMFICWPPREYMYYNSGEYVRCPNYLSIACGVNLSVVLKLKGANHGAVFYEGPQSDGWTPDTWDHVEFTAVEILVTMFLFDLIEHYQGNLPEPADKVRHYRKVFSGPLVDGYLNFYYFEDEGILGYALTERFEPNHIDLSCNRDQIFHRLRKTGVSVPENRTRQSC